MMLRWFASKLDALARWRLAKREEKPFARYSGYNTLNVRASDILGAAEFAGAAAERHVVGAAKKKARRG